ncbi:hypothetical protein V1517DRAFT_313385 [Lipomyces orientalis]|uniref:Uncharacterized protein n=1 Tax=Lipomyces orientalis TaxID=1233043 RepID=A0ACC3TX40_9ASCO
MSSMDIDQQDGQGKTGNGFTGRRFSTRGRGGFRGRQSHGRYQFQHMPHAPAGDWGHDMYTLSNLGAPDTASNQTRGKKNLESNKSSALAANSFAARIGKAPPLKGQKGNGVAAAVARPTTKEAIVKQLKDNPLFAALQGNRSQQKKAKVDIKGMSENPAKEKKFEIKGSGGKTYVRISNLAVGTTEDDVRAFLGRLGVGIEACKTYAEQGAITAEVLFTERSTADACVSQIDNAFADGRIIHATVISSTQLKAITSESKIAPVTYQNGSYGVRPGLYSDAIIQRGRGFKQP